MTRLRRCGEGRKDERGRVSGKARGFGGNAIGGGGRAKVERRGVENGAERRSIASFGCDERNDARRRGRGARDEAALVPTRGDGGPPREMSAKTTLLLGNRGRT